MGTFSYRVYPFVLCNAPATFQWVVLGIFPDLTHDCVDNYMDDFTVYGLTFETYLNNLENVLKICKETNISLNPKKCHMLQFEGIVLRHHIFAKGIKVDPSKIEVIVNHLGPKSQKDVRSFLGHVGY